MKNLKLYRDEYNLVLSSSIVEDEAISPDLKMVLENFLSTRKDYYEHLEHISWMKEWLDGVFDKERQDGLKKEYLRFARKLKKEDRLEARDDFKRQKYVFENHIMGHELDSLNTKNSLNGENHEWFFNFNPLADEFIFVKKQNNPLKTIKLSRKEYITYLSREDNFSDITLQLYHIQNLETIDENLYFEVLTIILHNACALVVRVSNRLNIFTDIIKTKIKSEPLKYALIKKLFNNNAYICFESKIFHLTDLASEYRFKIVKDLVSSWPISYFTMFSQLPIMDHTFSEDQRFELAKIVVSRQPHFLNTNIRNFQFKEEEKRFELAKIATEFIPEFLLQEDKYLWNSVFRDFEINNLKYRKELFKIMVSRNPDLFNRKLFNMLFGDIMSDIHAFFPPNKENYLNPELIWAGLTNVWVKKFLNITDDKTLFKMRDIIFAENNRRENIWFFLGNIFFEEAEKINKLSADPTQASRQFFIRKIWLRMPESFITNRYSSKTIEDFYYSAIEVYKLLWKDFFEKLNISKELISKDWLKNLTSLFQKLLRVFFITKEEENIKQRMIDRFAHICEDSFKDKLKAKSTKFKRIVNMAVSSKEPTKNIITLAPDNISRVAENLDMIFIWFFKETFKINDKEITIAEIERLEEKWWNLDILYTLIARYYWNSDWVKEIPPFARVVESVLEDKFQELRYTWYEGDEEDMELAKDQVKTLEWKNLENYKTNPNRLSFLGTSNEPEMVDEYILTTARWEFIQQCLRNRHVDCVKEDFSTWIIKSVISDFIPETIELIKNSKPKDILDKMDWIDKEEKIEYYLLVAFTILAHSNNKQEFEKLICNIQSASNLLNIWPLENDLSSIISKLRPISNWNDVIIFTTIFDDPKLLLEIWDLVDAGSCQNYKNWTHIQSLLWYVSDANIKWIVSFSITEKDFAWDQSKYKKAWEIIKSWDYEVAFNAPKKLLKISSTATGESFEITLNKAVLRRILKLWGLKSDKPWIFVEREYFQNHYALPQIRDEVQKLISNFTTSFGWSVVNSWKNLKISKSKNPGWVYSDEKQWIMIDDYEI
jgi:hypothetical protein